MRRSSVLIRVNKEAELSVDFFLCKSETAEHMLLKLGVGDSYRAGGNFDTVQDEVVALCSYLSGVAVYIFKAFVERHCEGMVHSEPCSALFIPLEERKFRYPEEVVPVGDNAELLCHHLSERAESGKSYAVLVRNDKSNVSLYTADFCHDSFKLSLSHELGE